MLQVARKAGHTPLGTFDAASAYSTVRSGSEGGAEPR